MDPVRLLILVGLLTAGPIYYWALSQSKVIFVTLMLSASMMMWLMGRFSYSRMLGAGHILFIHPGGLPCVELMRVCRGKWSGLVPPLNPGRRPHLPDTPISLVFELPDVIR